MQSQQAIFPVWMRGILLIMTAYNVLWGVFIGWFPETFYQWVTESEGAYPEIIVWQGRAVLAMAVVYLLSAIYPGKMWYLMLFGAFTKIAGGIWFYFHILNQQVGDKGIFHLIMNDAIWVPLLLYMCYRGRKSYKALA